MRPRCEFVDDLIPLILDAHDHWWPRDLVALSTVSPSWLFYVRKRLYPYPTILSFPAARLLVRTLTENNALASLIVGICLRPMAREPTTRPKPAELRGLRFLLGLEGLKSITLGGELSMKAERFLRFIAYADNIQHLHIDGSLLVHRLTSCPSLEWDESLAFTFPNLEKLRLTRLDLDIIPPTIPSPSSLSSLILENVHIMDGYLPHLLNGAKSLNQLHITTSDITLAEEQLRLVLASCAVKCLHYDMQKDSCSRFMLDVDSEGLEFLRCLHLEGLFIDLDVLRGVNEEYRNLEELVVTGRSTRVSSKEWVQLIGSGAFAALRRLGLPWGTNIPPFRAWVASDVQEIRDACTSRKPPLILL